MTRATLVVHPLKAALDALGDAAHVADYHRDVLSDEFKAGNEITDELIRNSREADKAERKAVRHVLAVAGAYDWTV